MASVPRYVVTIAERNAAPIVREEYRSWRDARKACEGQYGCTVRVFRVHRHRQHKIYELTQ